MGVNVLITNPPDITGAIGLTDAGSDEFWILREPAFCTIFVAALKK